MKGTHPMTLRPIAAALLLSSCTSTGALIPQAAQTLQAVCAVDPTAYAAGQVAGVTVPVPGVANAATIDAALVHPLVVQACAALNAVPVAVGKTIAPK